jgi:hypothetical protein
MGQTVCCKLTDNQLVNPAASNATKIFIITYTGAHHCKMMVMEIIYDLCIYLSISLSIYLWLYSPFVAPWPFFSSLIFYTVGRTPWTGDRPAAKPLPTHRTTQTRNKRTQTSVPRVGYEPHDPSVWGGEGSSCLRPRGHFVSFFSFS